MNKITISIFFILLTGTLFVGEICGGRPKTVVGVKKKKKQAKASSQAFSAGASPSVSHHAVTKTRRVGSRPHSSNFTGRFFLRPTPIDRPCSSRLVVRPFTHTGTDDTVKRCQDTASCVTAMRAARRSQSKRADICMQKALDAYQNAQAAFILIQQAHAKIHGQISDDEARYQARIAILAAYEYQSACLRVLWVVREAEYGNVGVETIAIIKNLSSNCLAISNGYVRCACIRAYSKEGFFKGQSCSLSQEIDFDRLFFTPDVADIQARIQRRALPDIKDDRVAPEVRSTLALYTSLR